MDYKIPVNRLGISDSFSVDALSTIGRVIQNGCFIHGFEHGNFERNFALYCGVNNCIAVGNGTDALEIALRSVGVMSGDEVILQANAGFYGTTAILAIGAIPVYADINTKDHQLDSESLARCISRKTKCVIVTHLYGKMGEVDLVRTICDIHSLALVEDCAQAHGAVYKGKKAGGWGDVAAFSFYPTKNLGAFGDGGAVVTSNMEIASRASSLRQYGWSKKYFNVQAGRNSRLDEIQAAILNLKLPGLDRENERRREIISRYQATIHGEAVILHGEHGKEYVAHLAIVLHPDRSRAIATLTNYGIETAIHYPAPDHQQPLMRGKEYRSDDLTNTEAACRSIFTIPCYPNMTDLEVERVCSALSLI